MRVGRLQKTSLADWLDWRPLFFSYVRGGSDCGDNVYDLFAVVNQVPAVSVLSFPPRSAPHVLRAAQSGSTEGGHYYTYARTLSKVRTAEWYEYNDAYVHRIDTSSVRTANAYVLFYQRRAWNGGRGEN